MSEGTFTVRVVAALALLAPGLVRGEPPAGSADRAVASVRIDVDHAPRAGETVDVLVLLLDANGDPLDAPRVALDCDAGELGALARSSAGVHRASLTIPRVLPHHRTLLLVARAGDASGERTLPLAPGPPAAITLAAPDEAHVGSAASVRLHVTVLDAFGNAAAVAPRVAAARGAAGRPWTSGAGRWEIEYVPPRDAEEASDELTVEAGDVRVHRPLRLASRGAWLAFAPWSGAVATDGSGAGLAVGLRAGAGWRVRREELSLLVDVAAWRLASETSVALAGARAALEHERAYVPVTVALEWGHRLGRRASTWLAIGGGVARMSAREALAGQDAVSEVGWGPAVTASVALGVRAGRGVPFLEARGVWIDDPGLVTWAGPVRALLLAVGYRFDAR